MKIAKSIFKYIFYVLLIPLTYLIIAMVLMSITVDRKLDNKVSMKSIYLSTNGVHLDIIIPKTNLNSALLSGLKHSQTDTYLAFGWGDENFYLNTPNWGDLTFTNAFSAMFLKSTTLMHVTRHNQRRSDWVEIKVNPTELKKLNSYLMKTFETDQDGRKIRLKNKGYTAMDEFYKSKGSYSCISTCNSWVNMAFKESGLKACTWTPFDFGLLNKYK